jgi:hypothetical protein
MNRLDKCGEWLVGGAQVAAVFPSCAGDVERSISGVNAGAHGAVDARAGGGSTSVAGASGSGERPSPGGSTGVAGASGSGERPSSGGSTGGTGAQGGSTDGGCVCTGSEKAGEACSSSCDADSPDAPWCLARHCGVVGHLVCVEGIWELLGHTEGTTTPWDFVCAPEEEGAYGITEITQGQCCGARVSSATDPLECRYCPAAAPVDGSSCNLPAECGGDASSRIIDCFYRCCCYGHRKWAQCDGQRWHVVTDCSPK